MEIPAEGAEEATSVQAGFPELTELGQRIELLRIRRGISKQALARGAGTSRQQLWRVMTGKSELTSSLRERLADVLRIDARHLGGVDRLLKGSGLVFPIAPLRGALPAHPDRDTDGDDEPLDLPTYLADGARIERTLRSLPGGADGRRLRRDLLNLLEEIAAERGLRLTPEFFALRGRALNGDL